MKNFTSVRSLLLLAAFVFIFVDQNQARSDGKKLRRSLEEDGDDEEEHGDHEVWIGVYDVSHDDHDGHRLLEEDNDEEELVYSLELFKAEGNWPAEYMLLGCVKTSSADTTGLEEAEESLEEALEEAEASLESNVVSMGGVIECHTNVSVYNLSLGSASDTFSFVASLHFASEGAYAVIMEHPPSEFKDPLQGYEDADAANLIIRNSENGEYAAAAAQEPAVVYSEEKPPDKWGVTILAAFLVSLPSVVAILLSIPFYKELLKSDKNDKFFKIVSGCGNAFASGVLLSTAVFLMLPEALHMIGETKDESQAAAAWGSMILAAFFVSYVMHSVVGPTTSEFAETPSDKDNKVQPVKGVDKDGLELVPAADVVYLDEGGETDAPQADSEAPDSTKIDDTSSLDRMQVTPHVNFCDMSKWKPISYIVCIGDFMHNFVDGMFIAIAFRCSNSLGWEVAAISIAHELPQEFGDFHALVMTGGCTAIQALVWNFLTALSCVFGAIVYLVSRRCYESQAYKL